MSAAVSVVRALISSPRKIISNTPLINHAIYNPSICWRDPQELLNFICKNIIFNQGGIIAINKPAGLPIAEKGPDLHAGNINVPENLSLSDVSKQLCRYLKCENLIVVKSLIRNYSGITLFSPDKDIAVQIKKSLDHNRCQLPFSLKYWAICLGIPYHETLTESIYTKISPLVDGTKVRHYIKDPSKNEIKSGAIDRYTMRYKVESKNEDLNVSLISLYPSSVRNWSANIYLSQKLCPLLGDHVYSHIVKHLSMGNVLASPSECTLKPQKLPTKVKEQLLQLFSNSYDIPTMFHFTSIALSNLSQKSSKVKIHAEPPPLFQKTCDLLGLKVPELTEI